MLYHDIDYVKVDWCDENELEMRSWIIKSLIN